MGGAQSGRNHNKSKDGARLACSGYQLVFITEFWLKTSADRHEA